MSRPPPCCSSICSTAEIPRPVPKFLVVNSGSRTLVRLSAEIPGPLSVTQISAPRIVSRVVMVMTGVSVNLALDHRPCQPWPLMRGKQVDDGALNLRVQDQPAYPSRKSIRWKPVPAFLSFTWISFSSQTSSTVGRHSQPGSGRNQGVA